MSWTNDLANAVEEACLNKRSCRIAVHTRNQAEMGRKAAQRLAPKYGAYPGDIQFELIPRDQQEIYLIGMVLE